MTTNFTFSRKPIEVGSAAVNWLISSELRDSIGRNLAGVAGPRVFIIFGAKLRWSQLRLIFICVSFRFSGV